MCDGFICHGFTTGVTSGEVTLAPYERTAKAGRRWRPRSSSSPKQRQSSMGKTPASRSCSTDRPHKARSNYGWEGLHEELNMLSKKWADGNLTGRHPQHVAASPNLSCWRRVAPLRRRDQRITPPPHRSRSLAQRPPRPGRATSNLLPVHMRLPDLGAASIRSRAASTGTQISEQLSPVTSGPAPLPISAGAVADVAPRPSEPLRKTRPSNRRSHSKRRFPSFSQR